MHRLSERATKNLRRGSELSFALAAGIYVGLALAANRTSLGLAIAALLILVGAFAKTVAAASGSVSPKSGDRSN